MGVIDMAKMVAKANQARKRMNEIQGVGQSGPVSIVTNGLYDWVDEEINEEDIISKVNLTKSPEEIVKQTISILRKDFKNAFKDAKKQVEKEMASSTSMDDLKDMFQ